MELIEREIRQAKKGIKAVRPTSPLVRDYKDYVDALQALKRSYPSLIAKHKNTVRHILTTPTIDIHARIRIINRQILGR